jgi:hypothetical protein
MVNRSRPLVTYIAVFVIMFVALSIISPDQFQAIVNVFTQNVQLFVLLLFIAIVFVLLRRGKRL